MRKGQQLYIEGKLQTRKWQDQQGQDRYTTEIVVDGFSGVMQMLGGKNENTSQGANNNSGFQNQQQQGNSNQNQNTGFNQNQQQNQQQNTGFQNQGGFAPQQSQQGGFNPQMNNNFDDDIAF